MKSEGPMEEIRRVAPLPILIYEDIIRRALAEDLGRAGDITSDAILPDNFVASGDLVARESGRIAGLDAALLVFRLMDPAAEVDLRCPDGNDAAAGAVLARVRGRGRALLAAERTALNLLGRLSGIATITRDVVKTLEGLPVRVVATRKTTPGLRVLEKYAVRLGGGGPHRYGLDDAVLIKDNHRALAGGLPQAVARARVSAGHMVVVEVEVDTLEQLDEALSLPVDVVLLDNMPIPSLREAVRRTKKRVLLEASGGITPANVREVAETGVDIVSLGWITHSARALDVAFDITSS